MLEARTAVAASPPVVPALETHVSITGVQRVVAAAILPMVAVTIWLAAASDHLARPLAAGLYVSYLVASSMAIGVYWWVRRPASRFGPLLAAFGVLAWLVSWQGANAPLAFDIGVLAEGPAFALTFYLFLAFPTGRIEPPAARWLMVALVLAVASFFLPWALFTPVIAGGGPLTACAPACPPNVLQVGTAPGVVDVAGHAETYAALAICLGVFVVYLWRLHTVSRPQRRALMAVAVTSLLFLPAYFVTNFATHVLEIEPASLTAFPWAIVGARVLLPLGFLIALLQADRFAATAQRALLERLVRRPTPEAWRDAVAGALDDPALEIGYYDPLARRFREAGGEDLARPPTGSGRVWVPVDSGARTVAAMVVDEALAEDPELVAAAASATVLAVENGALEGELRASRARIAEAGRSARRRLERDLHDTAQQRLIALRIHLSLAGEELADGDGALLEHLGAELDDAIDELREVTAGLYPPLLRYAGPGAALKVVAARSPLAVSVTDEGIGRHSQAVESAIYFCCVECLQNAAKHAGPGAGVAVRLDRDDGRVRFTVEDDGPGFDPDTVPRGAGLGNLEHRLSAIGGTLEVWARPGHGTRVRGTVPVPG